jgi:spore germination protein KB
MLSNTGRLSARQVFFISAMCAVVYASRFMPTFAAAEEGATAWLTPFLSALGLAVFLWIYYPLCTAFAGKSFGMALKGFLGKWVGTLLALIVLVWLIFMTTVTTRLYSERIVSIFITDADINIFTFFFLLAVGVFVHFKPVIIARIGEIIFAVIVAMFLFGFLILAGLVDVNHLLPFIPQSVPTFLYSGAIGTGIWGFGLYIFFLTDHIDFKVRPKKRAFLYYGLFVLVFTVLILVTTIGSIGPNMTGKAILPFFDAIKVVSLFGTFNRVEVFYAVIVGLVDYIASAVYVIFTLGLLRDIFGLKDTRPYIWIYILLIAILSNIISRNYFELEIVLKNVVVAGNFVFLIGVPLLLLIIGKIRKLA